VKFEEAEAEGEAEWIVLGIESIEALFDVLKGRETEF